VSPFLNGADLLILLSLDEDSAPATSSWRSDPDVGVVSQAARSTCFPLLRGVVTLREKFLPFSPEISVFDLLFCKAFFAFRNWDRVLFFPIRAFTAVVLWKRDVLLPSFFFRFRRLADPRPLSLSVSPKESSQPRETRTFLPSRESFLCP